MVDTMQKQLYIFGANSRAKTLKGYFEFLYPEMKIVSFLVDDMEGNETFISQIPVRILENLKEIKPSIPVYIATKGIYHQQISKRLEQRGFEYIIPVTVELDNSLRNQYVKKYYTLQGREFIKLDELCSNAKPEGMYDEEVNSDSVCIYMAQSIYDKPLQQIVETPKYLVPIRVGAALMNQQPEEHILTDNTGDNISGKNRQYSELTALYWIWKHASVQTVGLCHYRRHFILPDNWQDIMEKEDIDVILPVPTYVAPSIAENYCERHEAKDWFYLMELLKTEHEDYYVYAEKVFSGNLYSPCNMFIMKKAVLNELCSWMFPILFQVEEFCGQKEDIYQNRYLGFISERLITLFFAVRYNDYHIVYADKSFLN